RRALARVESSTPLRRKGGSPERARRRKKHARREPRRAAAERSRWWFAGPRARMAASDVTTHRPTPPARHAKAAGCASGKPGLGAGARPPPGARRASRFACHPSRRVPVDDRSPVLVVDDDPDIRETLREVIEAEGFPVVSAVDGQKALDALRGGLRPS